MFDDIKNLFIKNHGNYSRNLQFVSLVIIFLIMVFFTKYFSKTYGFVIILIVFALYISNSYVNIQNTFVNDFNKITMVKLQLLQDKMYQHINKKLNLIKSSDSKYILTQEEIRKIYENNQLDSLYIDANMIYFLESIISLYDYDSYTFYSLLKSTNNILKIKRQIDEFYAANKTYPINISEMFESALELKTNALNNIHNFIYSVPKSNTMFTYINKITHRYNILISRITDSIYKSYKNSIYLNGIDTSTKFVSYNKTKPYDYKLNHPLVPNAEDKLIQFYL
jgi:hypothetical protein